MKKLFTFLAACLLSMNAAWAKDQIYAVFNDTEKTMTLYYDSQCADRGGLTDWWYSDNMSVEEINRIMSVKTAILDASMKNARPTSTDLWFCMFTGMTKIQHLDYLNTEEVWDMTGMFLNCKLLTSIDLSHFNTEKVINMSNLFDGCEALANLDLSHFYTGKVEEMGYMFSNCGVRKLDLFNFDTKNVTNMEAMFRSCHDLVELDLSSFDMSKVAYTTIMFVNCEKLKTIYCNANASQAAKSDNMFKNCTSLVGGNGTVFDANHSDGAYARPDEAGKPGYFTKIELGDPEVYAVFNDATKTMTLYYDKWKDKRGGVTGWTFLDAMTPQEEARNKAVKTVIIDGSMRDARPTGTDYWFCDFNSLTQIQYIENLNTEDVTDMSSMFKNCWALEELDLTHFNTGNVLYMDNMFQYCKALISLDLRSFTTSNLVTAVYMFYGCSALEKILCEDDWSKIKTISSSYDMFYDCTSLKGGKGTMFDANHIGIEYARPDEQGKPGYFTATEPEIYAVFDAAEKTMTLYYDGNRDLRGGLLDWRYYNNMPTDELKRNGSVQTAILDESMKDARPTITELWFALFYDLTEILHLDYLNTEQVLDMLGMFANCTSLTSVDLSHFNTEKVTNMNGMFQNCYSLTSLDLSHFNTGKVVDMGYMFYNCYFGSIQKLDLSNFDTKNVTNMEAMFYYCGGLVELDLRSFDMGKVNAVAGMFYDCNNLKTIYCNADASQAAKSDNMFHGCTNLVGGNGTVFDANHIDATYARPDEEGKPGYFTAVKTGLRDVQGDKVQSTKVLRNGILFIERGNKTYNAQGTEVK